MTPTVQTVAEAALQLSPEDREALVERLLVSLEPADALHPAWRDEIGRRVAALQSGTVKLMTADDALSQLAAHIHSRRPAA